MNRAGYDDAIGKWQIFPKLTFPPFHLLPFSSGPCPRLGWATHARARAFTSKKAHPLSSVTDPTDREDLKRAKRESVDS
jgi:hypothetical protein